MGKKTAVFVAGQHVFAKVKGYANWPAKITKVLQKHRYSVYFYGTGETASVKSEDLDPYTEIYIKRYNTDRQLKKPDYKEAVDQIQQALSGNDPAPLNPEVKEEKEIEFSTDNITDNDNSADESQLQIVEETPKSTPQPPKKKQPDNNVTKIRNDIPAPPPETPEAKENDEKVSRSGRKIKEKKMNLDEMDPDEMFTQPRKRFKPDESKQKTPIVTLSDSTSAIEEFRASKMHILLDPIKKSLLENQYEMIHVMQDVKLALGLEQADIVKAVELLESFKTKVLPNITDLMLLKYPNTVDTIKRLRKYIGNVQSWRLDETQVQQFQEKAEIIRLTASSVYDKFKELFSFSEDSPFWKKFADEQKKFHAKYNVLNPCDLFEGLSYEELDSLVNDRMPENDIENSQIPSDHNANESTTDGIENVKPADDEVTCIKTEIAN